MKETLSKFFIGNIVNICAVGEVLETQTNSHPNKTENITAGEKSACQNHVIENNFGDKSRKAVDNAVMIV